MKPDHRITIDKVPFSIKEIITEMEEIFRPYLQKKGLEFICELEEATSGLVLRGDKCKLKLILNNLVSNAGKFTLHGNVEVRVGHKPAVHKTVELEIRVIDTGIGINPENLERIFHGYDITPSSTMPRFPGIGFGLPICKRLAELQGGEISVSSEPGVGSIFTVIIPFHAISTESPGHLEVPADSEKKHREKPKVLLVDDDEMSRILAENILKKNSVSFVLADNGSKAMELAAAGHFDFVLTDINMPGMDGITLAKKIRETTRHPLKIIAVTADSRQLLPREFDGILVKPFEEAALLELVTGQFEKKTQAPARSDAGFSIEQLKRISDGNMDFVYRMLEKFITSATENSAIMLSALASGKTEKLLYTAHKSIPSYHMLGLFGLVELLQEIEKSLRSGGSPETVGKAVHTVTDETAVVVSSIRDYLEQEEEKKLIKNFQ